VPSFKPNKFTACLHRQKCNARRFLLQSLAAAQHVAKRYVALLVAAAPGMKHQQGEDAAAQVAIRMNVVLANVGHEPLHPLAVFGAAFARTRVSEEPVVQFQRLGPQELFFAWRKGVATGWARLVAR